jgi:hypothetical protein
VNLRFFHAAIPYPAPEAPTWAGCVERWYQLDPFAYLLPEAFTRLEKQLEKTRPSLQFLACSGASNLTDAAFVKSQASSPTKFVHTLPNIRASSLLSVMRWNGPVYSLHQDPFTLAATFRAALRAFASDKTGEIWIWNVTKLDDAWSVQLFTLSESPQSGNFYQVSPQNQQAQASSDTDDVAILRGFWDSRENFKLGKGWVVRKA